MSYTPYSPDALTPMFFQPFKIKPYVYEKSFSFYEQIGQASQHVNDVIKVTNDMGLALKGFESYILNELTAYDSKIKTDVTNLINDYITDGSLSNLINQTLLNSINQKVIDIESIVNGISYEKPIIEFSIQPNKYVYKKSDVLNGLMLNALITNKSEFVKEIKYFKNNQVIQTKTFNSSTTNDSFIDGANITTSTSYKISVNDSKETVVSDTVDLFFVNPFFHGVMSTLPNSTNVTSMIEDVSTRSNKKYVVSPNGEYIVFAYPSSYGDLKSIMTDDEEMIDSFVVNIVSILGENYNVYYLPNLIYLDNINIEFIFN